MAPETQGRPPPERLARIVFAAMALLALGCGLALYAFAERLGLDATTAQLIATAFLIAAVVDVVVLYAWDRLFKPRR
jgi:drug/metabolite transporter (DMT)-like permease